MRLYAVVKKLIPFLIFIWLLAGWPPFFSGNKLMDVAQVSADTEEVYASSHIAGDFSSPTNAVGSTASTWAGVLNSNSNYTSRWAMGDPSGSITGTQTISVLARKGNNTKNPTIAINLYENGSLVQSVTGDTAITSTTGQTVSGTFNASAITNANNVEIEVVEIGQGGSPSDRNSAQIDYIRWTVNLALNEAPTFSISQPDGSSDTVVVGSSYNITYNLSDVDNTVTAAFYYDTNNTGLDGTAISGTCASASEGSGVTCPWDTTGIIPGSYYVYGITNDGVNGDVTAYSSGQITIESVSISVSITTDGTIAYGTLGSGESEDTDNLSDTQTAQNDGNVTEDLNIKTNVPAGWSLGSSSSLNTFVHEFSTNSGGNWTILTTADSYQTLVTGVSVGGAQNFDMRFTSPSPSSASTEKTITITIQAVQN